MPTVAALLGELVARTGLADPDDSALARLADPRLLHLRRDAARAGEGLPRLLGTARRGALVAWDAATTTWEGWDTATGHRLRLRAARPGHEDEARAAFAVSAADVLGGQRREDGVPHVRSEPIECALADLLPLDGDPALVARVVGGVLAGIAGIHAAGQGVGAIAAEDVVRAGGRWRLAWLGPTVGANRPPDPTGDLRALATLGDGCLLADLDPDEPLGGLLAAFLDAPPPSLADARSLLLATLAEDLAARHHALVFRSRSLTRRDRTTRLRSMIRRLDAAVPPPVARGWLKLRADGIGHVVVSDGVTVRGAAMAPPWPASALLPVIWHEGRLEPTFSRTAQRAWSTRGAGDEAGRAALQRDDGGDDEALGRLMRWLAAATRLRMDRQLLDARRR